MIATHIHRELRNLFKAVIVENKLVLTRVMKDVERKFRAIGGSDQYEAEQLATAQVQVLLPRHDPVESPEKKTSSEKCWVG